MCSIPEQPRKERREFLRHLASEAVKDKTRIWQFAGALEEIDRERYYRDYGFMSLEQFTADEYDFGRQGRKPQQLIKIYRELVLELEVDPSLLPPDWSKLALVLPKIGRTNWREWLDKARKYSTSQLRALVQDPPKRVLSRSARRRTQRQETGHESTAALGKDWRVSPPLPAEFYVDIDIWDQVVRIGRRGGNVLVKGVSGCGKTELAYKLAEKLNLPLHVFNFGDMSEPRSVLLGNSNFNAQDGVTFDKSRFIAAVEGGHCIILADEVNRAKPDALNILFTLMDRQGFLALEQCASSPIIRRGPGVCFFATANDGTGFVGTERMCAAFQQRFSAEIELSFPPPENEVQVLLNRCPDCPTDIARKLQRVAQEQRRMDDYFMHPISTRMLIAACEQVADGISIQAAFRFTILNKYSDDGGELSERKKLEKIFQGYVG